MQHKKSEELFACAQRLIPGGVNSPVRAFRGVGGTPLFIARGEGSRIYDVDGNEYIDYVGSWGPLILGHRFPPVIEALRQVLEIGTSFGAPTEREVELAELIRECVPSMEMVRLVNSGTEATMSALRVARGFTGPRSDRQIRGLLSRARGFAAGEGRQRAWRRWASPIRAGVPEAFAATTLALPYNSVEAVESGVPRARRPDRGGDRRAGGGQHGLRSAARGVSRSLARESRQQHGALLIFDEVMTGFRLALGGAQEPYGIRPDLTTLGKIIGGGLPIAAYGGRADVMSQVAPVGPMYQAGTLSGNPLAVSAGIAMLRHLKAHPEIYDAVGAAHRAAIGAMRRRASR